MFQEELSGFRFRPSSKGQERLQSTGRRGGRSEALLVSTQEEKSVIDQEGAYGAGGFADQESGLICLSGVQLFERTSAVRREATSQQLGLLNQNIMPSHPSTHSIRYESPAMTDACRLLHRPGQPTSPFLSSAAHAGE